MPSRRRASVSEQTLPGTQRWTAASLLATSSCLWTTAAMFEVLLMFKVRRLWCRRRFHAAWAGVGNDCQASSGLANSGSRQEYQGIVNALPSRWLCTGLLRAVGRQLAKHLLVAHLPAAHPRQCGARADQHRHAVHSGAWLAGVCSLRWCGPLTTCEFRFTT